jgi:hypothetical protein
VRIQERIARSIEAEGRRILSEASGTLARQFSAELLSRAMSEAARIARAFPDDPPATPLAMGDLPGTARGGNGFGSTDGV